MPRLVEFQGFFISEPRTSLQTGMKEPVLHSLVTKIRATWGERSMTFGLRTKERGCNDRWLFTTP